MSIACPRCAKDLSPGRHPTGIAWRCVGCGGQSLNYSQFRRMIPHEGADAVWAAAMEHPAAPRLRTRCPECRQDMAAVIFPIRDREIELDVCRSCQRLWLDRQEEIAGHLAAGAEPGPQPEAKKMSFDARDRFLREKLRQIGRRGAEQWSVLRVITSIVLIFWLVRMILRMTGVLR